jgi:hypothetical protein
MIEWERYDEESQTGLKPPGNPDFCPLCPWRKQCVERLGPKSSGERVEWEADAADAGDPEPAGAGNRAIREPAMQAGEKPDDAAALLETLTEKEADDNEAWTPKGSLEVDGETGAHVRASSGRASSGRASSDAGGLCIGFDDAGEPVVVPTHTLNTHVAVVGAAGSGKTYTAKIIAEEAVRNGVPVLAIDPQGDLVQFLQQQSRDTIDPRLHEAYDGFCSRVAPRVFTPGTSHGERLSLNPIRLPRPDDLRNIEEPSRRKEEELSMLQAVAANLVSLANLGGDRTAQETFLYRLLQTLPRERDLSLSDIVSATLEPESAGLEDSSGVIKKADREKLAMRLNSYVVGAAAQLFEGGTPLDLDQLTAPTADGRVPLNVVYLNALANDAQKQFFVAALASEVYRWMVTRVSAGSTSLLFYIDEARDYIPAGVRETPAKQPLIRLFSQGRKYGVGCLLCTQSPRSVDYNVFTNCSSKVIGRLEATQDVDRVREWFTTGSAPTWLEGRKGAQKGSFVARWEGGQHREGVAFRGRPLFSVHEGAWSPERVEAESRRKPSS